MRTSFVSGVTTTGAGVELLVGVEVRPDVGLVLVGVGLGLADEEEGLEVRYEDVLEQPANAVAAAAAAISNAVVVDGLDMANLPMDEYMSVADSNGRVVALPGVASAGHQS